MKKVFFGTALFLLTTFALQAQRDHLNTQKKERIEAYKIAFFTERLQLTPDESKAFWPLFNEFENEQDKLKEKYNLRGKKIELLSDEEVRDFIMKHLEMEREQVNLRRDYTMQFMEVLPIRKVALLQKTDTEFKKKLLQEMRKRRQQRGNN
ncbi:MAG TPA: hypothetical protein ENJ95_19835 [Bacteroidetes bacterium]|nr:hypothetical protein [Bacteroidota bacterium]